MRVLRSRTKQAIGGVGVSVSERRSPQNKSVQGRLAPEGGCHLAGAEVVLGHGFWVEGPEMAGAFGPGGDSRAECPAKAGIFGTGHCFLGTCPEKALIVGTGGGNNEKKSTFVEQIDVRKE